MLTPVRFFASAESPSAFASRRDRPVRAAVARMDWRIASNTRGTPTKIVGRHFCNSSRERLSLMSPTTMRAPAYRGSTTVAVRG